MEMLKDYLFKDVTQCYKIRRYIIGIIEPMSLKYIRTHYGVPAKKGMKVIFNGQSGHITGAKGAHLRIRFEEEKDRRTFHPTWEMWYVTESGINRFDK